MGKGHEQENLARKIHMHKKTVKSCSTSPLIKGVQIRKTIRWTMSPFGLSNI